MMEAEHYYCGRVETIGHGDSVACGEYRQGITHQCGRCRAADLEKRMQGEEAVGCLTTALYTHIPGCPAITKEQAREILQDLRRGDS